jgi:hypothetical protein
MTMGDIDADPHYLSRDAIVEVDGVPMQASSRICEDARPHQMGRASS